MQLHLNLKTPGNQQLKTIDTPASAPAGAVRMVGGKRVNFPGFTLTDFSNSPEPVDTSPRAGAGGMCHHPAAIFAEAVQNPPKAEASAEGGESLVLIANLRAAPAEKADDVRESRRRREKLRKVSAELLPEERVKKCGNELIKRDGGVDIHRHTETGKRFYGGNVKVCNSVWVCPVCSAKISERRRKEIEEAINVWWGRGNSVVMMTLTMSHTKYDSWDTLANGLNGSLSRFWRNRKGRKICADFAIKGRIRGLEALFGKNGPHIHVHILLFVEGWLSEEELSGLKERAVTEWIDVLSKTDENGKAVKTDKNGKVKEGYPKPAGFWASKEHGVHVTQADGDIADYISKFGCEPKDKTWKLSHEVSKSGSKQAEGENGRTPFQLLADYEAGDKEAGRQFKLYAAAMKNKHQIDWSNGLDELLGLKTNQALSDEEIGELKEEKAVKEVHLTDVAWYQLHAAGLLLDVLDVLEVAGPDGLTVFLNSVGIGGGDVSFYPPG